MTEKILAHQMRDLDFLDLGTGEDVIVDRPTHHPVWDIAPAVVLENRTLVFRHDAVRGKGGNLRLKRATARPDGRLLAHFLELVDASDERILAYASRYGRLGLCEHGGLQHAASDFPECLQRGRNGRFVEPAERWRENAARARAVLNAIAQFSKSGKVSDQTLIMLDPRLADSAGALRKARKVGWSFIEGWVGIWLGASRMRPRIIYDRRSKRFHVRLRGRPGLPSALALQLMTLAAQSKGIAICSSCALPFQPKRRPSPTRESYCPKCGIKAAWRDAQRRRRQKARGA